jgi:A1 cistron-splicing factor AAR2
MDNARARELVEAGAFVLALDFPARTGFGMDYGSWGVGESFKGMKMIPPGCHYIHVSQGAIHASAVEGKRGGRGKDPPARLGFFCWLRQGEVLVLRWDAFLEAPVVVAESTEQQKLAHAVRGYEYDQFLAPYPMEHLSKWDALTSRVSRELISKLGVVGKWLSAAPRDDAREAQDAEEGVESKETGEGGSEDRERRALLFGHPQYATVPARLPTARIRALLKSAQLAPAQVTQMHMDKTYVLEYVLETAGKHMCVCVSVCVCVYVSVVCVCTY